MADFTYFNVRQTNARKDTLAIVKALRAQPNSNDRTAALKEIEDRDQADVTFKKDKFEQEIEDFKFEPVEDTMQTVMLKLQHEPEIKKHITTIGIVDYWNRNYGNTVQDTAADGTPRVDNQVPPQPVMVAAPLQWVALGRSDCCDHLAENAQVLYIDDKHTEIDWFDTMKMLSALGKALYYTQTHYKTLMKRLPCFFYGKDISSILDTKTPDQIAQYLMGLTHKIDHLHLLNEKLTQLVREPDTGLYRITNTCAGIGTALFAKEEIEAVKTRKFNDFMLHILCTFTFGKTQTHLVNTIKRHKWDDLAPPDWTQMRSNAERSEREYGKPSMQLFYNTKHATTYQLFNIGAFMPKPPKPGSTLEQPALYRKRLPLSNDLDPTNAGLQGQARHNLPGLPPAIPRTPQDLLYQRQLDAALERERQQNTITQQQQQQQEHRLQQQHLQELQQQTQKTQHRHDPITPGLTHDNSYQAPSPRDDQINQDNSFNNQTYEDRQNNFNNQLDQATGGASPPQHHLDIYKSPNLSKIVEADQKGKSLLTNRSPIDTRSTRDMTSHTYDSKQEAYKATEPTHEVYNYSYNNRRSYDNNRRGYDNNSRGYDNNKRGYDNNRRGYDNKRQGSNTFKRQPSPYKGRSSSYNRSSSPRYANRSPFRQTRQNSPYNNRQSYSPYRQRPSSRSSRPQSRSPSRFQPRQNSPFRRGRSIERRNNFRERRPSRGPSKSYQRPANYNGRYGKFRGLSNSGRERSYSRHSFIDESDDGQRRRMVKGRNGRFRVASTNNRPASGFRNKNRSSDRQTFRSRSRTPRGSFKRTNSPYQSSSRSQSGYRPRSPYQQNIKRERSRSPSQNRKYDNKIKIENNNTSVAQPVSEYYQLNIENDMAALNFNDQRIIELTDKSTETKEDTINPIVDEVDIDWPEYDDWTEEP